MNVKPGDIAIVIKSLHNKQIGKIGRIVCAGTDLQKLDGIDWQMEFPESVASRSSATGKVSYSNVAGVNDAWVRSVSGLPDTDHIDTMQPIKEATNG